jgi:predicted dehydrogenase
MAISSSAKVLAASDRVRYAIIGVGNRGQQDLKDAIACSNAECVAVADIYSSRRINFRANFASSRSEEIIREIVQSM